MEKYEILSQSFEVSFSIRLTISKTYEICIFFFSFFFVSLAHFVFKNQLL